jgi:hypothetical protein
MLDEITLTCPHCGERFTAFADPSSGDADYIEDCPVCCRPIQLHLQTDGDGGVLGLDTDRDD